MFCIQYTNNLSSHMSFWVWLYEIILVFLYILKESDKRRDPNRKTNKDDLTVLDCELWSFSPKAS